MNRRWICNDVWMDILPSFDRPKLGLNLALLSYRFDALVDKHFDGKSELPILSHIQISKDIGPEAKVSEWIDDKLVDFPFPLPDRPLPNKIRFKHIQIHYIDHSVIKFLRSNKHIWDRMGTGIELNVGSSEGEDVQPIWDVFARQIWPIFAPNIRDFVVSDGHHLDNLRRRISPTILTDLNQLNSIISILLYPNSIADDETNAIARQVLAKWLHTPAKDGQPKRLRYYDPSVPPNLEWLNNFKEAFLRATTSVSYTIQFNFLSNTMPSGQFELVNERTNEKLTLMKDENDFGEFKDWLLKRCPIIGETAAVQTQQNLDHFNGFFFCLCGAIGPLSPPTDQSDEKVFSTPGPSDQRKKEK